MPHFAGEPLWPPVSYNGSLGHLSHRRCLAGVCQLFIRHHTVAAGMLRPHKATRFALCQELRAAKVNIFTSQQWRWNAADANNARACAFCGLRRIVNHSHRCPITNYRFCCGKRVSPRWSTPWPVSIWLDGTNPCANTKATQQVQEILLLTETTWVTVHKLPH